MFSFLPPAVLAMFQNISVEILVVAGVLAIFELLGIYLKKGGLFILVLSLYPASLFFSNFPYMEWLGGVIAKIGIPVHYAGVALFGALTLGTLFLIRGVSRWRFPRGSVASFTESITLSAVGTALFFALLSSVTNLSFPYVDSGGIIAFLTSESARFWILIAPLILVAWLSRDYDEF